MIVKGNITLIPASLRPSSSGLPPQASSLSWDFDNRMVTADVGNNGSVEVSHKYDAIGRRVARTDGSSTVVFVQSGQQTIADYPLGATPSASTFRYVYASYIDEPVMRYQSSGAVRLYYVPSQSATIRSRKRYSHSAPVRYALNAIGCYPVGRVPLSNDNDREDQ